MGGKSHRLIYRCHPRSFSQSLTTDSVAQAPLGFPSRRVGTRMPCAALTDSAPGRPWRDSGTNKNARAQSLAFRPRPCDGFGSLEYGPAARALRRRRGRWPGRARLWPDRSQNGHWLTPAVAATRVPRGTPWGPRPVGRVRRTAHGNAVKTLMRCAVDFAFLWLSILFLFLVSICSLAESDGWVVMPIELCPSADSSIYPRSDAMPRHGR